MASERTTQRVLLGITACLLLAFGLTRMFERRAPEATPEPAAAPAAAAAPEPDVPAAPPAPAAADASGIPHTKLPLRLLATVVGADPTLSLATIADEERGANAVMKEGQAFQGRPAVQLAAIERARVLIDNHGVREQLVLVHHERAPEDTAVHEITPEQREWRRDLARRLRDLTDRGADALAPPERGGLLAEGDVNAAYEGGELIGVQIDDIRAGGLYDRIGLRNGDVVTDINGVSLRDPGAMAKVVALAATSPVLEITVERADGPPTTVQLPTEELGPLVAPE
jgi:general secretion pathway protein C